MKLVHAPRACEATAATTCAGGGLGPQPRVVRSPVPCSAAIGSDCHTPNAFLSVARFKLLPAIRLQAISVTYHTTFLVQRATYHTNGYESISPHTIAISPYLHMH